MQRIHRVEKKERELLTRALFVQTKLNAGQVRVLSYDYSGGSVPGVHFAPALLTSITTVWSVQNAR